MRPRRPSQKKDISKKGTESKLVLDPDRGIVEGFKMEEVNTKGETTNISSSGIRWFAPLFVIFIIGLAIYEAKRHR